MKAMIHVQHLLGTGPAVRMAALATALAEAGIETALVTGNRLPPTVRGGDYEILELPFARAKNASVTAVVDDRGAPIDEGWKNRRRNRLLALFEDLEPDILITESWPFGQAFFDFELDPLMEAACARTNPPLIVCSLRDVVLRESDPEVERGVIDRLRRSFDAVLVNGDPNLLPLEASFGAVGEIADLIRYTGYLHAGEEAPDPHGEDGVDEIIVSCGGGAVGDLLLSRAIDARALSTARNLPWRLLVGSDMDDLILSRLVSEAGPGVIVERARRDFPNLLKRARLSLSQGGYNTVVDILAAGCPAVFVPFARAGGTEQTQRTQALAELGGAVVVPELDLSAEVLAEAVDRALALEPRLLPVAIDGTRESVRQLMELGARRPAPAAV